MASGARGPQVYKLYGSDGKGANFDALPEAGKKPEECGWKFLADVDTRKAAATAGGQYVASVSDSVGLAGVVSVFPDGCGGDGSGRRGERYVFQ